MPPRRRNNNGNGANTRQTSNDGAAPQQDDAVAASETPSVEQPAPVVPAAAAEVAAPAAAQQDEPAPAAVPQQQQEQSADAPKSAETPASAASAETKPQDAEKQPAATAALSDAQLKALFSAARKGPAAELRRLVGELVAASGTSTSVLVNTRSKGWLPIHSAALVGNADTIAALLEFGADPAATLDDGATPLHLLCEADNSRAAALLLDAAPALLEAQNANGDTPLFVAVEQNQLPLLKLFVERGAKVAGSWADLLRRAGEGAPECAAFIKTQIAKEQNAALGTLSEEQRAAALRFELVAPLAELARISALIETHSSPAEYARAAFFDALKRGARLPVVQHIVEAFGAQILSAANAPSLAALTDASGARAILYARARGDETLVKYLQSLDGKAAQPVDESSAAGAASSFHKDALRLFKLARSKTGGEAAAAEIKRIVNSQPRFGDAPMGAADDAAVAISVDTLGKESWRPIHSAALAGNVPVVAELALSQGCRLSDARIDDGDDATPLHLACEGKAGDAAAAKIVGILLEAAVRRSPEEFVSLLRAQNKDGGTALHVAAANGHIETIKAIFAVGAARSRGDLVQAALTQDQDGNNALHVAALRNHPQAMMTLMMLLDTTTGGDRMIMHAALQTPNKAGQTVQSLIQKNKDAVEAAAARPQNAAAPAPAQQQQQQQRQQQGQLAQPPTKPAQAPPSAATLAVLSQLTPHVIAMLGVALLIALRVAKSSGMLKGAAAAAIGVAIVALLKALKVV